MDEKPVDEHVTVVLYFVGWENYGRTSNLFLPHSRSTAGQKTFCHVIVFTFLLSSYIPFVDGISIDAHLNVFIFFP